MLATAARRALRWTAGIVALAALAACGGDGTKPPSGLSYSSSSATYIVGTAITALSPSVTGTVESYSVSPTLPAGLSLSSSSGQISGTPTATAAAASYTITATNKKGATSASLSITVNPVAPSALSYASPQSWTVGTAITALGPTVTGTVTSYSVSPALPAGLALSISTGVISGTPTAATASAAYTVTASNVTGSTTYALTIVVNAPVVAATIKVKPNVEAGQNFTVALRDDGTVWAWGFNRTQALGQGCSTPDSTTPIQVKGPGGVGFLTDIVQISVGYTHVLALRSDGAVFTWGTRDAATTGGGSSTPPITGGVGLCSPAQIVGIGGTGFLGNVVKLSAGSEADAALLGTGEVVTWGNNISGATGLALSVGRNDTPARVPGLDSVIDIAMELRGGYAVKANGQLYGWGTLVALGNGLASRAVQEGPAAVASGFVSVSTTQDVVTALATDGTARAWGLLTLDGQASTQCADANTMLLTPGTPRSPGASATAYTAASVSGSAGLYLYGGTAYWVGGAIDIADPTGICAGVLTPLKSGVIGVSRSWTNVAFAWDSAGVIYGFGNNSTGQMGVGDAVFHAGGVAIPGFRLYTQLPTGSQVFFTDFESGLVSQVAPGTAAIEGVQNFAGLGSTGNKIAGSFLRSATLNTVTLTLANLPAHTRLSLEFLFAAIDSLDGFGTYPAGDFFVVKLDGTTIFREAFANADPSQVQTYLPPPGVTLARRVDLGFGGPGGYYTDSAYEMGLDPTFRGILHSGSTATFTFYIEGSGAQTLSDESWAMDNLKVTVY